MIANSAALPADSSQPFRNRQPAAQTPLRVGIVCDFLEEEWVSMDLVADMLKAVKSDEYERCLRLLVHDLGELSYMIEHHSEDPDLLQRCDALVNRHAETLRNSSGH